MVIQIIININNISNNIGAMTARWVHSSGSWTGRNLILDEGLAGIPVRGSLNGHFFFMYIWLPSLFFWSTMALWLALLCCRGKLSVRWRCSGHQHRLVSMVRWVCSLKRFPAKENIMWPRLLVETSKRREVSRNTILSEWKITFQCHEYRIQ